MTTKDAATRLSCGRPLNKPYCWLEYTYAPMKVYKVRPMPHHHLQAACAPPGHQPRMLSGNVIDYSLIHNSLSGTTTLTTQWAVPWRPHALLTLHLNLEAATREFRQVQYFPPLPASDHGPPFNHRHLNSASMTSQSMTKHKPGQTGSHPLNSTSCRSTRGRLRDEVAT